VKRCPACGNEYRNGTVTGVTVTVPIASSGGTAPVISIATYAKMARIIRTLRTYAKVARATGDKEAHGSPEYCSAHGRAEGFEGAIELLKGRS
jgi:hypothetical protein